MHLIRIPHSRPLVLLLGLAALSGCTDQPLSPTATAPPQETSSTRDAGPTALLTKQTPPGKGWECAIRFPKGDARTNYGIPLEFPDSALQTNPKHHHKKMRYTLRVITPDSAPLWKAQCRIPRTRAAVRQMNVFFHQDPDAGSDSLNVLLAGDSAAAAEKTGTTNLVFGPGVALPGVRRDMEDPEPCNAINDPGTSSDTDWVGTCPGITVTADPDDPPPPPPPPPYEPPSPDWPYPGGGTTSPTTPDECTGTAGDYSRTDGSAEACGTEGDADIDPHGYCTSAVNEAIASPSGFSSDCSPLFLGVLIQSKRLHGCPAAAEGPSAQANSGGASYYSLSRVGSVRRKSFGGLIRFPVARYEGTVTLAKDGSIHRVGGDVFCEAGDYGIGILLPL